MTTHPLPTGTRVRHYSQQWPAARTGTATIREVRGPWPDGTYEYRVTAGQDFSRRTGPDNPETRDAWWSSTATVPAAEEQPAPCGRSATLTSPCSAGAWCCKGPGAAEQPATEADRPKPPPMDPRRILGIDACPTPLTHNWGCGCPTDEQPAAPQPAAADNEERQP